LALVEEMPPHPLRFCPFPPSTWFMRDEGKKGATLGALATCARRRETQERRTENDEARSFPRNISEPKRAQQIKEPKETTSASLQHAVKEYYFLTTRPSSTCGVRRLLVGS